MHGTKYMNVGNIKVNIIEVSIFGNDYQVRQQLL